MRAQDRSLRKWVDANGDVKIHNENNIHRKGTKVVDNKEKKNTEIDKREGMNLNDGRRIDVAKVGEVGRGTRKTETNDRRRGIGNDKSVDEETQKQSDDSGTESIQRLDGRCGSGNISDNGRKESAVGEISEATRSGHSNEITKI